VRPQQEATSWSAAAWTPRCSRRPAPGCWRCSSSCSTSWPRRR